MQSLLLYPALELICNLDAALQCHNSRMSESIHNFIHILAFILSILALTHLNQSLEKSFSIRKLNYSIGVSLSINVISMPTTYFFSQY